MLESFLVPGRQDLDPTRALVHGPTRELDANRRFCRNRGQQLLHRWAIERFASQEGKRHLIAISAAMLAPA